MNKKIMEVTISELMVKSYIALIAFLLLAIIL